MMPGIQELTISTIMMTAIVLAVIAAIAWFGNRIVKKMNAKQKSRWLIAHLVFIVILFSGVIGNMLLGLLILFLTAPAELYAAHLFMRYFSFALVTPGALGIIITGVWLASRTHWGLTTYYWVICKWVAQTVSIVFGGVFLNIWMVDNIEPLFNSGIDPLQNPDYLLNLRLLLFGLAFSLAVSVFLVVISLIKPWGKRKKYKSSTKLERVNL